MMNDIIDEKEHLEPTGKIKEWIRLSEQAEEHFKKNSKE